MSYVKISNNKVVAVGGSAHKAWLESQKPAPVVKPKRKQKAKPKDLDKKISEE